MQSGQVTHAVRDTQYDELDIKAGHYIGIQNSKIVTTDEDLLEACEGLLAQMMESGDEVVTDS